LKGDRIGTPAQAAATAVFQTAAVARYGRSDTVNIAVLDCLWYGVFGAQPVRMVLARDRETGPMLALVTTDLSVTGADLVARYAARWAIEVTFFDTRQTLGVGQAPKPHRASGDADLGVRDVHLHPRRAVVRAAWPPVRDRRRPPRPRTVVSVEDRSVVR
jgi:hypothetical protein